MTKSTIVTSACSELSAVLGAFAAQADLVTELGNRLAADLAANRCVFTAGNGGSAADALHMAEELTGKYSRVRRPLAAMCLAADATALTCIANDFGYDEVFARPLEALGKQGDWFVGFSTSGNSPNVIRALDVARHKGIHSILLTGKDGGKGRAMADHCLIVASDNTARIQEVHTLILHCWLEIIDDLICGSRLSQ